MGYKALIEPQSGHHKYSTFKVYGVSRLESFYFFFLLKTCEWFEDGEWKTQGLLSADEQKSWGFDIALSLFTLTDWFERKTVGKPIFEFTILLKPLFCRL